MEKNMIGELNMYKEAGIKPNFSDIARRYGKDRHTVASYWMNLPRFRLHPYAAVLAAPSICLASNSSGLRLPSAEWIRTLL